MDILHAMARSGVGPSGQLAGIKISVGIGRTVHFVIATAGGDHVGSRLVILRATNEGQQAQQEKEGAFHNIYNILSLSLLLFCLLVH